MYADVKWPAVINVDNQAAISFQGNTNPNSKIRGQFNIRDSWIRELQDTGKIKAVKVPTDKNLADLFTKCLPHVTRAKLFAEMPDRMQDVVNAYRRLI